VPVFVPGLQISHFFLWFILEALKIHLFQVFKCQIEISWSWLDFLCIFFRYFKFLLINIKVWILVYIKSWIIMINVRCLFRLRIVIRLSIIKLSRLWVSWFSLLSCLKLIFLIISIFTRFSFSLFLLLNRFLLVLWHA